MDRSAVQESTGGTFKELEEEDHGRSEQAGHHAGGLLHPPAHTRFKAGPSGNSRGRPKGTLNVATVLERTLRETVVSNEKGKRKTITKLEAALKALTNKAASGEIKALQVLAALVRSAEEREIQPAVPDSAIEEVDERVVLGILKRLGATSNGDHENETDVQ
jgi:hypothetical protein